ncbi:MAG: hypothetical protein HY868_22750 [Chloroflexi bacterium]|nr:hypothetical protein [Chloroflexota bacterium]
MDPTVITALVGAFATITAAAIGALAYRAQGKNSVELEKELALLKKNSKITSADYGIRILSPTVRQAVSHAFSVNGILKELPEGLEIWTFVMLEQGKDIWYWPQERARIEGNAWYSQINYLDGDKGDTRQVLAYIVGKYGQTLIRYCKEVGQANAKHGALRWTGISQLTDDMVQVACVDVTLLHTEKNA